MKIAIRKYSKSDAPAFQAAVLESYEHLSKWFSWCTPDYTIDEAVEWSHSSEKTWDEGTDYRFLIENLNTGEILGAVGINQVVPQHMIGNLGYWVRQSAINKGVCTQAAKKVVGLAFKDLGFQRIEITVPTDNHASNAVAVKLGAKFEGTFRNKIIFKGISVPAKCYSIIPSDYES